MMNDNAQIVLDSVGKQNRLIEQTQKCQSLF
mgnify:CR=1 FL=1